MLHDAAVVLFVAQSLSGAMQKWQKCQPLQVRYISINVYDLMFLFMKTNLATRTLSVPVYML